MEIGLRKGGCNMKADRGMRRWAAVALLLAGTGSCTRLIDHSAVRCQTDDDCLHFSPYHPYCRDSVCIASGLNPAGCYYPKEKAALKTAANDDFLNQCTTAVL